jgi:PIN like domain
MERLQDRIWIPHQVGLEFSRNRLDVIADQDAIFDLVDQFDAMVMNKFFEERVKNYGKRGHAYADLEKLRAIFQQTKQALRDELQRAREQYPASKDADTVLERLGKLFQGKIGCPYSDDEMTKLTAEFEKRYKQQIPPGFKDEKKQKGQNKQPTQPQQQDELPDDESNNPANKHGDVILWYQMMDYARQEKKPIIFVGDDVKEDWWERKRRGKTSGPRAELRREMKEKAGVQFYMYTMERFLEEAQKFLVLQVQEETIKEVREKRIQEEKARSSHEIFYQSLLPATQEIDRVARDFQQILNAIGGVATLRLEQALLEQMRPFLSDAPALLDQALLEQMHMLSTPSDSSSEGEDHLEELPSPEDTEQEQEQNHHEQQDQQDESSDVSSDASS